MGSRRCEAAADLAHVPPHAFRVPVVDRREGPDPAVVHGEDPHAVGPPHDLGRQGDDGPVVELRIALAATVRRQQPLRSHHAQHLRLGDADPIQEPQPRVDLAVALALEGGPGQIRANRREQLLIREQGLGTASRGDVALPPALRLSAPRVERRARALPRPTHPLEAIPPPGGRGGRRAHRRDLRIGKGRRRSAARARSRSSSFSHRQLPNVPLGRVQCRAGRLTGRILQPELETGQSPLLFHSSRR